jgi:hypothetical protein
MNANFLTGRNEGDIKNAMLLAFKDEALRRITPHGLLAGIITLGGKII